MKSQKNKLIIATASVIAIASLLFLKDRILPPSSDAYEVSSDVVCENNLKRLHRHILEIDDTVPNGLLSKMVNDQGALVSWRVVVFNRLLKSGEIDYTDPWDTNSDSSWDSESNKRMSPSVLFCQDDFNVLNGSSKSEFCDTSYLLLVRDGIKFRDLPHNSVILVESAGCGVHWMKPEDMNINVIRNSNIPFGIGKLNSYHADGVRCMRKDGVVLVIPKNTSKEKVIQLLEGSP